MEWKAHLEKLKTIIYPDRCIFCSDVLAFENKTGFCPSCLKELKWLTESLCPKCGKPLELEQNGSCFDCFKGEHVYDQGRSLWVYEGQVKESIHRFKYHQMKQYKKAYIYAMIQYYKAYINWSVDIITPIPLHNEKLKTRKYNQSELLAVGLGLHLDIPVCRDLLIRVQNTKPQKELSDVERINNIKDAFIYNQRYDFTGKNVLLIDDIYTTGSTIDECAKQLKNNEVNKVFFLTVSIGKGL